uniref:Uncharacterized protein n=1 Tax=Arundo donax TaxID=35708 RepID=A0A0A9CBN9_ARUDO
MKSVSKSKTVRVYRASTDLNIPNNCCSDNR